MHLDHEHLDIIDNNLHNQMDHVQLLMLLDLMFVHIVLVVDIDYMMVVVDLDQLEMIQHNHDHVIDLQLTSVPIHL